MRYRNGDRALIVRAHLLTRHEEATGHHVYAEYWTAECTECPYGVWLSPLDPRDPLGGGYKLVYGLRYRQTLDDKADRAAVYRKGL